MDESSTDESDDLPSVQQFSPLRVRIGIMLILLSGVLWFSLFAIPFLPITVAGKAGFAATVFATVQIAWWSGAALAGPTTVKKISSWFRNWRRGKR